MIFFPQEFHRIAIPSTLLSTVSRSVSFPNTNNISAPQFIGSNIQDNSHLTKKHSVVHLAMWIHVFGMAIIIFMVWAEFIPEVGKVGRILILQNNIIKM